VGTESTVPPSSLPPKRAVSNRLELFPRVGFDYRIGQAPPRPAAYLLRMRRAQTADAAVSALHEKRYGIIIRAEALAVVSRV
jgi:hypothetical protein